MFFDRLPGFGYVCAHRGARSIAPENTLLAFQQAVRAGADFLELDVHRVADGSLMVFHDETLTRTTDVNLHGSFARGHNARPAAQPLRADTQPGPAKSDCGTFDSGPPGSGPSLQAGPSPQARPSTATDSSPSRPAVSGTGQPATRPDSAETPQTPQHDDAPQDIAPHDFGLHDFGREELHRLDAGSWFLSADPFGTIRRGEVGPEILKAAPGQRIPTLRAVLEFTRRVNLPVNIEIKDQLRAPGDLSIVSDVLKVLDVTHTRHMVLVSSFNHAYLRALRQHAPDIPTAALIEDRHPADTPEGIAAYLAELGAAGYHPDEEITTPDLVRALATQGIRVTPYTVNDMDRALQLIDAGCFGITTDFPQVLRRLVDGRG